MLLGRVLISLKSKSIQKTVYRLTINESYHSSRWRRGVLVALRIAVSAIRDQFLIDPGSLKQQSSTCWEVTIVRLYDDGPFWKYVIGCS